MGATCGKAKFLRNNKRQNDEIIMRVDDELLMDYPKLIDIKGVRCFTSFTKSNK